MHDGQQPHKQHSKHITRHTTSGVNAVQEIMSDTVVYVCVCVHAMHSTVTVCSETSDSGPSQERMVSLQ